MEIIIILLFVLGLVIYLSTVIKQRKQNINNSFLYGFSLSVLAYLASSFLFFWFAVFRRMAVLNIPFKFDSEVAFATVIIPVMVAIPWVPFGIITGLIFKKKGNKIGMKFLYTALLLISITLLIVFWNLPYN